jgi:GNAT superfamily N-acetyltransferase
MIAEPSALPGVEPLVRLPWDSAHFGFPVARLTVPARDTAAARRALDRARRGGVALVYWQTAPDQPVSPRLLDEFTGRLVDRRVTYLAELADTPAETGEAAGGVTVREYPPGPAPATLKALGVSAGVHSRFGADPRIPAGRRIALYATWVERSTRRELADTVLVAEGSPGGPAVGLVTAGVTGDLGTIGLIAVAAGLRGRGIGRALLATAHRWLRDRGAARVRVVTQLANVPACRLYEAAGYRRHDLRHTYHFWPAL